jgi:hypothetical protein
MNAAFRFTLCFTLILPIACSDQSPVDANDTSQPVIAQAPAASQESVNTPAVTSLALPPQINVFTSVDARSVQQLMNEVFENNARQIWNAVSYTVTAEGATENLPDTDEEWASLMELTVGLRIGGEALMDPLRPVTIGIEESTWPDWQYTPTEIAELRESNIDEWRLSLVNMQSTLNSIVDSINRRDVAAYTQLGVTLNQACQGCHGTFWYKPLGR